MLGDVRQDIAVLRHERLKSDMSATSIITGINLVERRKPSDRVDGCLQEANACLPDSHHVSIALTCSLERLDIVNALMQLLRMMTTRREWLY